MASQADEETFAGQADERLDNSGSPEQTRKQIDRLLAERGIPLKAAKQQQKQRNGSDSGRPERLNKIKGQNDT